jgi:hypothetical protein
VPLPPLPFAAHGLGLLFFFAYPSPDGSVTVQEPNAGSRHAPHSCGTAAVACATPGRRATEPSAPAASAPTSFFIVQGPRSSRLDRFPP